MEITKKKVDGGGKVKTGDIVKRAKRKAINDAVLRIRFEESA